MAASLTDTHTPTFSNADGIPLGLDIHDAETRRIDRDDNALTVLPEAAPTWSEPYALPSETTERIVVEGPSRRWIALTLLAATGLLAATAWYAVSADFTPPEARLALAAHQGSSAMGRIEPQPPKPAAMTAAVSLSEATEGPLPTEEDEQHAAAVAPATAHAEDAPNTPITGTGPNNELVQHIGDRYQVRVPLARGSTTDSRHYRLAEPAGVAINLPHAFAAAKPGVHNIGGDVVKRLWIREYDGGSQIRVLFGQTPSAYEVNISEASVVVTITP